MAMMMFVNLPVRDLPASMAFYERLGAVKNERFTDATAACMVLSDTIHAMLLTHDKFRQFTSKEIPDAHRTCQVMLCLSAESREAVDAMVEAAREGGRVDPGPKQDHGFMYGRSLEDPDGHVWEVMWMDLAAAEAAMAACPA